MNDQTFPVGHEFAIGFNPIEDRMVLTTELKKTGSTCLLLTRRMVLLVLSQIVSRLPVLSNLNQTPANYWQEVLQFTHQQALEQHRSEVNSKAQAESDPVTKPPLKHAETEAESEETPPASTQTFIATELTTRQADDRLQLAFRGIPINKAMQPAAPQLPVLALSLEAAHAHQVIQLLLNHAATANWHLPVDLPWLDTQGDQPATGAVSH